jgi:hypothetical protein
MLSDQHETYDGETEVTILLNDVHQEYTACWDAPLNAAGQPFVTARVVFDASSLADIAGQRGARTETTSFPDAYGEQQVWSAALAIFGDPLDDFRDDWGEPPQWTIWMLRGSIAGVGRAWSILGDALTTTVSGDDDAFDYWPNTMDMLWELAVDLDALGQASYRKATKQIAHATLTNSSGATMPYTDRLRNEDEQREQRELLLGEWAGRAWLEGVS